MLVSLTAVLRNHFLSITLPPTEFFLCWDIKDCGTGSSLEPPWNATKQFQCRVAAQYTSVGKRLTISLIVLSSERGWDLVIITQQGHDGDRSPNSQSKVSEKAQSVGSFSSLARVWMRAFLLLSVFLSSSYLSWAMLLTTVSMPTHHTHPCWTTYKSSYLFCQLDLLIGVTPINNSQTLPLSSSFWWVTLSSSPPPMASDNYPKTQFRGGLGAHHCPRPSPPRFWCNTNVMVIV